MASERVLVWFVALSLFFTFTRAQGMVWRRLAACFLVLGILGLSTVGEKAAYFIAPLWFGILFVPRVALWQLRRTFREGDWENAVFCARILNALYPKDEWLSVIKLSRAQAVAQSGDIEAAHRVLKEVRLSRAFISRHPFLLPIIRGSSAEHPPENTPESIFTHSILKATYALILLHFICFLLQLAGDAMAPGNYPIRLGGLLPSLVIVRGEYWRLFTTLFLHAGFIHFASNMFGLYILGPFVERTIGVTRFLVCYFIAGIGSSLFIVLLTMRGVIRETFSIGASGAVLGLVGATAAIFSYAYYRHRDISVLQPLKSVLLILGIQTAFDLTTPQVSFVAHAGGVLSGLMITLLMLFVRPLQVVRSSD